MENARKINPVARQKVAEADPGSHGSKDPGLKAPDQEHGDPDTEDIMEHGTAELSAFGGAGLDAHADTKAARRISAAPLRSSPSDLYHRIPWPKVRHQINPTNKAVFAGCLRCIRSLAGCGLVLIADNSCLVVHPDCRAIVNSSKRT